MRKFRWPLLAVLTVMLVFAFILGSPAVRFPLALGLLRIAFFLGEQVWPGARMNPAIPE